MIYDAIVLGSGHNGLILQAYLGAAGLSTVCLETRENVGGGLATVEYPAASGFLHNTHSFYHRALTRMPWYEDLNLARHGAVYVEPALNVAMLLPDGRVLEWWTDFERTVESFARFSGRDADNLRRWRNDFLPIVRGILVPEAQAPPLPPAQRIELLRRTPAGRRLLEVSQQSPLEFVQREFEHPAVQAGLLFFNGLREVDLRLPGFGHHIPALLASDGMAQMCAGGSRQLATALASAVREQGGEIRVDTTPQEIIVENGRAAGVLTTEGDLIRARRLVASSLNPQQTFLDLIDERHLPADWLNRAKNFRYNLLAPLFSLHVNLNEAPRYDASADSADLDEAFMVILGLEHIDQFHDIISHHEQGTIPPTVMWGSCPTKFDPTQAPDGCHTAFMWEKLPFQLHGDSENWNSEKDRHGRRMLEEWSRFASNVSDPMEVFTRTPHDTQQSLRNMQDGDLLVGAFAGDQVGYHRPFAGAGHYRGHLPGLYLCGSCCHPGGNVTGLPGYNATQVVLADLGIAAHWAPNPFDE